MFNYANSIEIVFEQSDNMLELMNIYQRELKKLIALHECVSRRKSCAGPGCGGDDWTAAGEGWNSLERSGGAASGKLLQAMVFGVTHGIVMFLGYIRDAAEPTMGESYGFISGSVYF